MIVVVKVKPNSKQHKFENGVAYLKAAPIEGKANEELIELMAEHFQVRKSQVRIMRGATSRVKTIEIYEAD